MQWASIHSSQVGVLRCARPISKVCTALHCTACCLSCSICCNHTTKKEKGRYVMPIAMGCNGCFPLEHSTKENSGQLGCLLLPLEQDRPGSSGHERPRSCNTTNTIEFLQVVCRLRVLCSPTWVIGCLTLKLPRTNSRTPAHRFDATAYLLTVKADDIGYQTSSTHPLTQHTHSCSLVVRASAPVRGAPLIL